MICTVVYYYDRRVALCGIYWDMKVILVFLSIEIRGGIKLHLRVRNLVHDVCAHILLLLQYIHIYCISSRQYYIIAVRVDFTITLQ